VPLAREVSRRALLALLRQLLRGERILKRTRPFLLGDPELGPDLLGSEPALVLLHERHDSFCHFRNVFCAAPRKALRRGGALRPPRSALARGPTWRGLRARALRQNLLERCAPDGRDDEGRKVLGEILNRIAERRLALTVRNFSGKQVWL